VAAVASSDVVCELAKGKTIEEAKKLTKDDVIKVLGGMPVIKVHCSLLGIEALEKAIEDYETKQKRR
jgi:nitrogen fixation NifU-like protein